MQAHIQSMRDRGIQLLRNGSASQSVPLLETALEASPEDVQLYLYLATAYSMSDRMVECIDLLEHAASLAPHSSMVQYNLGVAHQKANQLMRAQEAYTRAVNFDASNEKALKALETVRRLQAEGAKNM